MRITKSDLKQMIKEELQAVVEKNMEMMPDGGRPIPVPGGGSDGPPAQYDPKYIADMEGDIRSAQDDATMALSILSKMGKLK